MNLDLSIFTALKRVDVKKLWVYKNLFLFYLIVFQLIN